MKRPIDLSGSEQTQRALALMRDQRDKALAAATIYRGALKKIRDGSYEPYSRNTAIRALICGGIHWRRVTTNHRRKAMTERNRTADDLKFDGFPHPRLCEHCRPDIPGSVCAACGHEVEPRQPTEPYGDRYAGSPRSRRMK